MSLPPFAPFPVEARVRQSILPEEWQLYLDSWTILSDLYLRLKDREFSSYLDGDSSLIIFLVSFFKALAEDDNIAPSLTPLRKKCFFLIHRICSGASIPAPLLEWINLTNICHVFLRSEQLRTLLQGLWQRKGESLEKSLQVAKSSLIKSLDSRKPEEAEASLNKIGVLLKGSPDAGTFMLTGSDFLDSLSSAYPKVSPKMQSKLVAVAYLGLVALLSGTKPNYSLLSDHLYSLKTSAEQAQKADSAKRTFLADLVTNTPLLHKVRDSVTTPEGGRVKNIAASLSAFQQSSVARPKNLVRRKVNKGKGKALAGEFGHPAFGEIHVHKMSMVSQIQDLFPDLGSGFVVKLLDEYNDNLEEVTAHLLEDSLPPHLATADRYEALFVSLPTAALSFLYFQTHLTPRSTPPPSERRNIFDNDEMDRLAVDTSRLHVGRKNHKLTADALLSDRNSAPNKSAILAALAAFDSDDDERDDTYDVEDVGGTVDTANAGADEADADIHNKNEESLFRAYSMTPDLFGRDSETRRGKARMALKSETGMTDEAIEGWGIMIGRDPRRLRRLETKLNMFGGQQKELVSTSYRRSAPGSEDEEQEGGGDGQRGGRGGGFAGRGRGRGRGRGTPGGGGRGGGHVAGPSDDKTTQAARQRKDASKGSRANHNRRDQRAKKMARGGFPG
ncbi:hypothetical protein P154DRAFT_558131 [Amniculicola lignicola CBS 123094]|uniref:CUE domain-containing protein n=1 Tax=Amniculicola lignicola CBS 123094 TaxID=1392246 RepID=A0A6A5X4F1_9PLEO|nr:hypothetical protein P154DRAFT_558131 [Amniculicola lignicola CBS 123094]